MALVRPIAATPPLERIVQSWDLSFSGKATSDFVVGQAWGAVGPDKYLLAQVRRRLSFNATIDAIEGFTARLEERFPRWRGHNILVEEASNGPAVIDVLRRRIPAVVEVRPRGDKVSRAHAISPQAEAGNLHLPGAANSDATGYDRARTPPWVQAFVEEEAAFPQGAHDDQVDAMAQAISQLTRRRARVRRLL